VKRIIAIAIVIALLASFSVVSSAAANGPYTGSFSLQDTGDTYSVPYTAGDWVDLDIVLTDDANPDDEVDIKVDDCYITTLYQNDGSVLATVSLPPGSYAINFLMVENGLGGPSPFSYSLTENEYTGNYVYPCVEPPTVGGMMYPRAEAGNGSANPLLWLGLGLASIMAIGGSVLGLRRLKVH